MQVARVRPRNGRLKGNAHLVGFRPERENAPRTNRLESKALCGYRAVRYWTHHDAREWESDCAACVARGVKLGVEIVSLKEG